MNSSFEFRPFNPALSDGFVSRAHEALIRKSRKEGWQFSAPGHRSQALTVIRKEGEQTKWERDYVALVSGANEVFVYRIQYLDDGVDRLKWIDRIPPELKEFLTY